MSSPEVVPVEVVERLAEAARVLLAEPTVQTTLDRIVELMCVTIDGCDHASVSFVEGRSISTPATSDPVGRQVDTIQYEANEGPCLQAIRDHEVLLVDDLADEARWPAFSRRAVAEAGVRSMMAFRLFAEQRTMGALNLFSRQPRAFVHADRAIGSVFAAHAAVALFSAIEEESIHGAMQSRDIIGQAKGILMQAHGIDADAAFEMLKEAAGGMTVRLGEVALEVTRSGPGALSGPGTDDGGEGGGEAASG